MKTKNSVVKIQNLIVNHESRPAKSNPVKENGYQESIISKIFKRITNNHSSPLSQQQTQATDIHEEEIRMTINLP